MSDRIFRLSRFVWLAWLSPLACTSTVIVPEPDAPDGGSRPNNLVELVVTPSSLLLTVGEQETLTAVGRTQAGEDVRVEDIEWSCDDPRIAMVDPQGLVTALGAGNTSCQAQAAGLESAGAVEVRPAPGDIAPSGLRYTSPVTYFAGQPIAPNLPTSEGGGIDSYRVLPSLPPGLTMDPTTGAITGTPRVPLPTVTYTVTGTNSIGSTSATVEIDIACDFAAPPPQDEDPPDPDGVDTNGDGVDGMACGPVFVATDGDDAAPGTLQAPVQSLRHALAIAGSATPPRAVYVAGGTYTEAPLTLPDGVELVGCYDRASNWRRALTARAVIEGGSPALMVLEHSADVRVDCLEIRASPGTLETRDSIAVWAQDNEGVVSMTDVILVARDGADGGDGVTGVSGDGGAEGEDGFAGCENSLTPTCGVCAEPYYAFGGFSPWLGANGGDGGRAGLGDQPGASGDTNEAGSAAGGAGGDRSLSLLGGGGDGVDGAAGESGSDGLGGQPGAPGGDGDDGQTGTGGGGGGGGAGGTNYCDSYGGTGGGGGAGGAPGTHGTGGQRGGASVGLVMQTSDVMLERVRVRLGRGGDGGAGGLGGAGGPGGPGGLGGSGEDDSGVGGNGGRGGEGGRGGHGGGGGGGHALGIVTDDQARLTLVESTLEPGVAGFGGSSAANAGERGLEADVWKSSVAEALP